jgi:hypothetical protein
LQYRQAQWFQPPGAGGALAEGVSTDDSGAGRRPLARPATPRPRARLLSAGADRVAATLHEACSQAAPVA